MLLSALAESTGAPVSELPWLTPEERREAVRLRAAGVSIKEIIGQLDSTRGTIYELLSAPVSYVEIMLAYVGAAATKSVILGLTILATAFGPRVTEYGILGVALLVGGKMTFPGLSVAGVNERGLYNSNLLLVETERAMMRAAEEVIVVADSTKFGKQSLAHLCPLNAVQTLVVDDQLSKPWQETIASAGVELSLATAASESVR